MLCTAVSCAGLTLGRTQDVPWVGKPLDILVKVQFDPDEDAQSVCLEADVSYGETPVDPGRVSVQLVSAPDGADVWRNVRVRSSSPVDEPIVTVNLRAGCLQKSARRYTLFADFAATVVEPIAAVVPSAGRARSVTADRPAAAPAQVAVAAGLEPAVRGPRLTGTENLQQSRPKIDSAAAPSSPRSSPPAANPTSPPAPFVTQTSKPAKSPGKSRLTLDPVDLLTDYAPVLRATTELLTQPQEEGPARQQALAWWRALNAGAQEQSRDKTGTESLENEIKSLQALTSTNQKAISELTGKLEQTESERYANGLVYGLSALLVVSLAALSWAWRRLRTVRESEWLHDLDAVNSLVPDAQEDDNLATAAVTAMAFDQAAVELDIQSVNSVPELAPASLTEVDFDFDLMDSPLNEKMHQLDETAAPALAPAERPAAVPARPDPAAGSAPGLRAIDTEELMDVRHQAEFFISIGQHEKAIEVLTRRVAQCGEASPLVCLDLLKIFHALGREAEFEFMRTEFNLWFAGRVPEFAGFGVSGRALDQYPQVMERIVALWPSVEVLDYIEGCIYQNSGEGDGVVFDLQAYLDLLFLHGVAKRIVRQISSDDDGNVSELLRIPAGTLRAQAGGMAHMTDMSANHAAPHRVGAQFRGVSLRSQDELPDPQADLATRGAPLGAMKLPPALLAGLDEQPQAGDSASEQASLTDFNFLNLR